ncbi:MAG: hypothetical protein CMN57_10335 [Gammaproteobacteria bacterium]|uniref:Uncharacterized protein n=1 Tax=Thiohalobacter thiocyanaticus TaxID=585455 RepID=A0A1Z4VUJ1_9GAMM|nr:DUF6763 family protein [Thiohalobacter thiocyanaticus]MAT66030.1 hypothetical protein [Gammaproteobacteria bacterium]BAZ95301.1 uncharacterized protein FOKN1_2944 [Thiohalobacter thiocyanaticus]
MATEFDPRIGDWYQTSETGEQFEIVAVDPDDQTVEIQYFDGTVEELDMDAWRELPIVPGEPPEDWSGSLDIEREDYGVDLEFSRHDDWTNPLDTLD